MKFKTNKSLTKRFKFTKNNKIIYRPAGQNHFLAKKTGQQTRQKRGSRQLEFMTKTLKVKI